jgi:hypothetical protein
MNNKILIIVGSGLLLLLGGCSWYFLFFNNVNSVLPIACTMEAKVCPDGSSVGRIGPKCEFAECPKATADFDKPIVMEINDKAIYPDGLSLVLKEINDSRCPSDVDCIWQGELSPLFSVEMRGLSEEVRLGTVNNKSVILNSYIFRLNSATKTSVIITVSDNIIK